VQNGTCKKVLSSSEILNDKIIKTAKDLNINVLKSIVYNSDAFYNETENPSVLFKEYGCSAIEMETFALFHNANVLGKKAACLLTISDNLVTKESLSSIDRQIGFDEMIKLALESIL
jgi:purine-nucleoside phosphorylase